ncbi:MAG: hypothetical protein ACKOD9_19985, partial [Rubrivivax sp.]
PGQVVATEPFAALLAACSDTHFASEFAGTTRLAKSYGSSRLYRLRKHLATGVRPGITTQGAPP